MRNSHGNRTGLYPYKNVVGHQTQDRSSAMAVLLLGSHVGHQVADAVAVAELIVIPGEQRGQ